VKHNIIQQRGNVLFLILLGVVLFAALSYAVTQNFGGGNAALSQSSLKAYANDVIFTAASYEKAVNKLISRGVSENRISFTRASGDGYELTPASSASEQVFNVAGGGANYLDPPSDVLDNAHSGEAGFGKWVFTGNNIVNGVGTAVTGDLIAMLNYMRRDVCIFINEELGITNPSGEPPQDLSIVQLNSRFTGTNFGTREILDTDNYLYGKKTGCFRGNNNHSGADISNQYFFYYVLYAR